MNENLDKYSQNYLSRQQQHQQYENNKQMAYSQQTTSNSTMEQSRNSNIKDIQGHRLMLEKSQEYNEKLKNIVFELRSQLKDYKGKYESSAKENDLLKSQNKLLSDKINIYVLRINTYEESEQNLKQNLSDQKNRYSDLENKYFDLKKKYKQIESEGANNQTTKKEYNQQIQKSDNHLNTNDDSPRQTRKPNSNNSMNQQQQPQGNNQVYKKGHSIDLSSGGSIQDIDKYAFQMIKVQQNAQQVANSSQQTSQKTIFNDLNQQRGAAQINSQKEMQSGKPLQQENYPIIRKHSLSPGSRQQLENNNQIGGGIHLLKNNYVNQMQTTVNNQTPIRSSTSVPALFRTQKNEILPNQGVSPINQQQKNNGSNNDFYVNQENKSNSEVKQYPSQYPQYKSLLFPWNNRNNLNILQNVNDEGSFTSLNVYSQNTPQADNSTEHYSQKALDNNYMSNSSHNNHQKPPIVKKNENNLNYNSNQVTLDQSKQNEGYGRINSHRTPTDSTSPYNLNSSENTKRVDYSQNQNSGVQGYPISMHSTTATGGDQSYLSNSQGHHQQSKQGQQSHMNSSANNSNNNNKYINNAQINNGNSSSQNSYLNQNQSSYDNTYSESNNSGINKNMTNLNAESKDLYSSVNNKPHPNRFNSQNDYHMYSTNPIQTSVERENQQQQSFQISSIQKSSGNNSSAHKSQANHGVKAHSVTDFGNQQQIMNHQISRNIDYERSQPQSETKIDSEIHTPQKPNIFQSKSVFNNNQLNVLPLPNQNVNGSNIYKENDFAEHLISNEGIQVKKRSQVLHASRRDPNTCQLSPTSPKIQAQYEDKQLIKALFGGDHQKNQKESGIPKNINLQQDKMFEISSRVENELDSGKKQDRVIPSMNPGFISSQHNYSLNSSSNNSYMQNQAEKRSLSIKNLSQNNPKVDSESFSNLDSTSDNRQKLRTSDRNNNNLKTIQIQPFGQSSMGLKMQKISKIIDNFIVISANQEKTRQLSKQNVFNVDQEIIFKAAEPKNDMENDQLKVVSKFCYPHGVEVHKYKKENISSDILKTINTYKELQSKDYFVFPIKSAESFEKKNMAGSTNNNPVDGIEEISNPNKFIYCVCVVARDYIDPNGPQQRMYKSENNQQSQYYYQVSSTYCILTKYPFFDFFFEIILQFINKMNINKKNLLSQMQDPQLKNILQNVYDYQQIDLLSFKKHINSGIMKVIQSCMRGEIAIDFNISHRFNIGQEMALLSIPQKEGCYQLEGKWGVMQTLAIMNAYEFLYILFSFLLEESLVFLSKNASTLSQTMMMFLSALKPFKWPHPFVMFLTNDLMHMFDSPFPLVIGINKSYDFIKDNKLYKTHSHCIYVNLDEFGISEKKESIYQSNTYTNLASKIKADYEQLAQTFKKKKDAYNDYSQQLIQLSGVIFDKVRLFFQETLAKLLPLKPILDSKNNLNFDQLKATVLKNAVQGDQFIEKFIQSQIFCYFVEEHYDV